MIKAPPPVVIHAPAKRSPYYEYYRSRGLPEGSPVVIQCDFGRKPIYKTKQPK